AGLASPRIAQCTRRTAPDDFDQLLGVAAVGLRPRLFAVTEDARHAASALAGGRALQLVEVDDDLATRIVDNGVRRVIRIAVAGETDARVRAVAKRLAARSATTAKRHFRTGRQRLALRIFEATDIGDEEGAVLRRLDLGSRILFQRL